MRKSEREKFKKYKLEAIQIIHSGDGIGGAKGNWALVREIAEALERAYEKGREDERRGT